MVVWKACCCGDWCYRRYECYDCGRSGELLVVAVAGAVVVDVGIAGIAEWNRWGELLAVAVAGAVVGDVEIGGSA